MFKINKLNILLPKFPENQVFDSRDIDSHSHNQSKLKPENFFNIIKKNNLSEIRSSWNLASLNYNCHLSKFLLLDIQTNNSFYRGIICGVSSKTLNEELVIPHEKVFKKRVKKLQNYLDIVKIQAEPVVFGTSFSKEINSLIKSSILNKPIIDFNYKNINYSIRHFELNDSINKFSKFYIVDGHHRTSSFKSFSKEYQNEHQLLTFLTDIKDVKSDKFTWQVIDPSRHLINSIRNLKKTAFKPDTQLFWAMYKNEYYVFNKTDLKNLSIINLEKWIIKSGDKIKRYYTLGNKKYNYSNGIVFNFPTLTFNQIIDSINKQEIFPQKSTFLEPKMLTGLTISELV